MTGFIAPYTYNSELQHYCWFTHFQFTVTRALRFSVFTSRILATALSQSPCHFKSHLESSFHILTHFLPLICNCQFRRLDSFQILCSQAHILVEWRLETRLFTSRLLFYAALCCRTLLYNHFARPTQKTASIVQKACLLTRHQASVTFHIIEFFIILHLYSFILECGRKF
jgi:hypothetical protein